MAMGIDWEAAHEALESMDDFARMDVSVAPYGPYAVLLDVLTKAKHMEMRLDRYESPIPYEITESGKAALK